MSLCISLKLRGEASVSTSNQEKSLGGTCSLPGTVFLSALTAVVWDGKHPPSALEVKSHRRKAATQIWAEDAAWQAHILLKQRCMRWRLGGGKRNAAGLLGQARRGSFKAAPFYPLFGWWCPCLTALSAAWPWLSFANLFVMVILLSLSSHLTRKKLD